MMSRDAYCYAAAAGADVEDAAVAGFTTLGCNGGTLYEPLRLRPRDEHTGAHGEAAAAEWRTAKHILHRFRGFKAAHGSGKTLRVGGTQAVHGAADDVGESHAEERVEQGADDGLSLVGVVERREAAPERVVRHEKVKE